MGLGLFLAGGKLRAGSTKYLEESVKENPNSSEVKRCAWCNVRIYFGCFVDFVENGTRDRIFLMMLGYIMASSIVLS